MLGLGDFSTQCTIHDWIAFLSIANAPRLVAVDEWTKWFMLRHGEEAALATMLGKLEWMFKWHIGQPLVVDAVFDLAFADVVGTPMSRLGDTLPKEGPITGFLVPFAPRGDRPCFSP